MLRAAAGYLEQRGVDAPRRSAELLMGRVLGLDRMQLYLAHDRPLAEAERDRLRALVARRARGEPVAYLLGDWEFYGHTLQVNSSVLVPRPETEGLVELALGAAPENAACIDLGTGSGAIAIALALEREDLTVTAVDVSVEALVVAEANIKRHGLEHRVRCRQSCYWQEIGEQERFDLLVSNPPYVDPAKPEILDAEVRDHEPAVALFTPPGDPAEPVRTILAGMARHMHDGGWMFLETGVGASEACLELMRAADFLQDVELRKDLGGVPRYLLARMR